MMIDIFYSLPVHCYLWLVICDLISESFYLKLVITCKNLFLSLVVVRLVIFLWLFSITAKPQLMLNRKWYQASKPEMEFHMINIIYAALSIRAQTEKTTFSCKDDCTLTKPTGCWTYSTRDFEIPLCHIPPLRSFLTICPYTQAHLFVDGYALSLTPVM